MNKKALLTGSTGGLGKEIADILAKDGWDLVLVNRSQEKSAEQIKNLQEQYPNQNFVSFIADLMDIEQIKKVCAEISQQHPKISALYNISGLLTDKRIDSPQGYEGHFALNSIAPYLMMKYLQPILKSENNADNNDNNATNLSVIVNFSTEAIKSIKNIDLSALPNPEKIGGLFDAYSKTKFAMTAATNAISEKLLADNIVAYSICPGPTKTQMTHNNSGMPFFIRLLRPLIFKPASAQARKLVNAVNEISKTDKTGIFIASGKLVKNPPLTEDKDIQKNLIEMLDKIAA
ncbi:MAG: SDR family NAD(P)-dependent oxidoreductase [Pseudomonadota bacterium]